MTQIPPAYPQNANVNVDPAGNVAAELPCLKCGYNLRGLSVAGRCPECGAAVGLSIHGDLLRFSTPQWVRTLQRGVRLIIAALAVIILGMILLMIVASRVPVIAVGAPALIVIAYILYLVGTWQLTEPDPSGVGEDRYGTSRKIIRIALTVGLISTVLSVIEALITVTPQMRLLISLVSGLSNIVAIVGQFAELNYLSKLALRIPDLKLAGRARFLMWAIGLSYGVVVLVGVVIAIAAAGAAQSSITALGCFAGIAVLFVLIFAIMYLLMLEKMGKRFGQEAQAAEQTWAAVTAAAG